MPFRWLRSPIKIHPNGEKDVLEVSAGQLTAAAKAVMGAAGTLLLSAAAGGVGAFLMVWRTQAILVDHVAAVESAQSAFGKKLDDHIAWSNVERPKLLTIDSFNQAMAPRDDARRQIIDQLNILISGQIHNRYILEKLPVTREDDKR